MIPPARKAPTKRHSTAARGSREEGRCAEALPILEKLLERQLELRPPYPTDEDALIRHVHRERRLRAQGLLTADNDFRHAALWEIGLCKFALRDYQSALVAFRKSRTFPFGSWCGNADREWEYRHGLYEGLTLELLGRAPEAIAPYAHAASYSDDGGGLDAENRLFDLYVAAGQIADLRQIAAQDAHIRGVAHRFRILDLEQARAWPDLVNERRSRFPRHADLVAQAVARHGDDTVPLLLIEVDKTSSVDRGLWRTLGLSVTPRTTPAIVDRARRETRLAALVALVEGMRQAGAAGQAAIAGLEKGAQGHLRTALDRPPGGVSPGKTGKVVFPPLPAKVRLPASIAPETATAR